MEHTVLFQQFLDSEPKNFDFYPHLLHSFLCPPPDLDDPLLGAADGGGKEIAHAVGILQLLARSGRAKPIFNVSIAGKCFRGLWRLLLLLLSLLQDSQCPLSLVHHAKDAIQHLEKRDQDFHAT